MEPLPKTDDYDVELCSADDFSEAEIQACIAIVRSGGAVQPQVLKANLPSARVFVIARKGKQIVGVGAIKRIRSVYASRIAERSGGRFDPAMQELGYVAVDTAHRGHRLSHRIVGKLLSAHQGPLFATTSSEFMKKTLATAGFKQKGGEWAGESGRLSLWIRE